MIEIKETIEQLEKLKEYCKAMQEMDGCTYYADYASAIDAAVEMMRKGTENG